MSSDISLLERYNALDKQSVFAMLFVSSFLLFCSSFQFPADLVTFAKEILNGKLHFLRIVGLIYSNTEMFVDNGQISLGCNSR